jgi:hypothetical protein
VPEANKGWKRARRGGQGRAHKDEVMFITNGPCATHRLRPRHNRQECKAAAVPICYLRRDVLTSIIANSESECSGEQGPHALSYCNGTKFNALAAQVTKIIHEDARQRFLIPLNRVAEDI